jgi:hypothetical protein
MFNRYFHTLHSTSTIPKNTHQGGILMGKVKNHMQKAMALDSQRAHWLTGSFIV